MRNGPQTQHRGSAGQDVQIQLTHILLPTAPGTCQLLKVLLPLISTPFYSPLGNVMLQMYTTMTTMLQLLTEHSLSKSVLTTGRAP